MGQSSRVLLVEGPDDKHVVGHLLDRVPSTVSFDILDKGGIDKLLEAIEPEIQAPGRVAVGIVADADDHPGRRWQAVSDRLRKAGIEAPDVLPPDGAIMGGTPRVGVWLMPHNCSPGELEDFVQKMVPPDDLVWPLAQKYLQDVPAEAREFPANKRSRAELHAWLATRKTPGRMGSAIGRGDLKTDGPLCAGFLAWIEGLFG